MSGEPERSPYTVAQMEAMKALIDAKGETKVAAIKLDITVGALNSRIDDARRRYEFYKSGTDIYENLRRSPFLRKRLF